MAYSFHISTGTGSLQTLTVPPYIDRDHIKVSVNNVPFTSFLWVTASTISLTVPAGVSVRVWRSTSPGARVTDYTDGVPLTEAALDNDSLQAFYLAQEQLDATEESIGAYGDLLSAISGTGLTAFVDIAVAKAAAASVSEANATAAAAAAAASYDSFDDRYLGAKASDPTVDNDGNALLAGAMYWNTTGSLLKMYSGVVWTSFPTNSAGAVSNTPAGNISSTNVQSALNELDAEKLGVNANAASATNASYAATAGTAGYATSAGSVSNATYATNAGYAVSAGNGGVTSVNGMNGAVSLSVDVAGAMSSAGCYSVGSYALTWSRTSPGSAGAYYAPTGIGGTWRLMGAPFTASTYTEGGGGDGGGGGTTTTWYLALGLRVA